jgi:hypothetical protein
LGSDETKMKLHNLLSKARSNPEDTKLHVKSYLVSPRKREDIKSHYPEVAQISNLLYRVKVESAIGKGYINVKAIRVYLAELKKNINSTIERGETPYLLIKKIWSEKRGAYEFEIVFMGARHVEDLSYAVSDPNTWKSWGEMVLSPEQIEDFIQLLRKLLEKKQPTLGSKYNPTAQ